MSPIKTITLVDGVKVCVPNTLNLISSYVLEEQQDWFEDEIKFIRKLISDGNQIIDIGANFGVYTLSMAKLIGPRGKIYSFEPATETAKTLHESVQVNGFKNVIIEKKAISKKSGLANFLLNDNPELNSLASNQAHTGRSELVKITTLDECMEQFNWKEIDFLKIDAEGEEENVIKGGLNFLKMKSPLVMFEVKAGDQLNLSIVNQFEMLGYKTYKLIPGLNILAPWKKDEVIDGYLLNLFCCKADRARILSDRQLLILNDMEITETFISTNSNQLNTESEILINLPYAKQFHEIWRRSINQINPLLIKSLASYHQSKISESAYEKYKNLLIAFNSIDSLCKIEPTHLRLSTLARIARECGNRGAAVNALDVLIKNIQNTKNIDIGEPFLLPSEAYEAIDPKDEMINFILSALLSSLEKNSAFSSFYLGKNFLNRLDAIIGTGFFDEEIGRRKKLIIERFGVIT